MNPVSAFTPSRRFDSTGREYATWTVESVADLPFGGRTEWQHEGTTESELAARQLADAVGSGPFAAARVRIVHHFRGRRDVTELS